MPVTVEKDMFYKPSQGRNYKDVVSHILACI